MLQIKFNYAIETLKIEKFRLINRLRNITTNSNEKVVFIGGVSKTQKNLRSVLEAISLLEKEKINV